MKTASFPGSARGPSTTLESEYFAYGLICWAEAATYTSPLASAIVCPAIGGCHIVRILRDLNDTSSTHSTASQTPVLVAPAGDEYAQIQRPSLSEYSCNIPQTAPLIPPVLVAGVLSPCRSHTRRAVALDLRQVGGRKIWSTVLASFGVCED